MRPDDETGRPLSMSRERFERIYKTIRDRMSSLIRSGATLEQVVAARLTSEWDATKGDPTMLLNRAYASMTRR